MRRTRPRGVRLPLRQGASSADDRLQRQRAAARLELLRSAGFGSPTVHVSSAIAQGQLPQESWFALGRLLTAAGGEPILLSWSGSMFEYLMPLLVMPTYENTLLDQTCKAAVARQIEYGRQRGVPWGMSESGYNTVDVRLNYQYRAFGVPGLGLKRGLADGPGRRAVCLRACADGGARGGVPESAAARGTRSSSGSTASTRPSTTPRRACDAGRRARSSGPSWRITRA